MPKLGASPSRTERGTEVRKTLSLKCARISPVTCCVRFVRSSTIVSSTPSISSRGLSARCTRRIVFTSSEMPSSAKYSHWSGMSTVSAAASAFTVSRPRLGGQSRNT